MFDVLSRASAPLPALLACSRSGSPPRRPPMSPSHPSDTSAGAYTVLTFAAGHGCEGSPTTSITIQVPEPINSVTPTRNPLYDVDKKIEQLAEPITDAHGNEITERVAEVTYTAKSPLPEGYRDSWELSLQLPDTPGETLTFPVVQACEEGENPWTEVPAEGQDAEELDFPAPTVTITESSGDGHGAAETVTESDAAADPEASEKDDDSNALGVVGLVVGAVGVIVGGTALARTRKQS